MALSRDAEQDRLAQETERNRQMFSQGLDKFAQVIKSADQKAIMRSALENNDYYAAFTASNEKLKHATFEGAKQLYDAQQQAFARLRLIVLLATGVGVLATVFSWRNLRRAIGVPLADALVHFERIANGDLTHRVEVHSRDEMGQMIAGLANMRESLVKTVESVRAGSDVIAHATREVATGNLDLSARTEEQAASLEETAASLEELSSTVHKNAENAGEAERLSNKAYSAAENGSDVVQRVVGMMGEINESSDKIGDIISIIEGIAFQTNILALNAAVEAARAGEQGRGFAVVASEVRNLAQRSSAAAKEIKMLIEQSVARVEAGSAMVAEAGTSMTDILGSVKNVTDVIQEIAAATVEQSQGIDQVSRAVTQMDEVTQQNAALVEQASAAAQSLEDQAGALLDAVALFKLGEEAADRTQSRRPAVRGRVDAPIGRRLAAH
jgi:methyl-accepting chemotaxis protein-1 (serine sensor receptor)